MKRLIPAFLFFFALHFLFPSSRTFSDESAVLLPTSLPLPANHIPEAAKALDISTNHYPFITHAHSSIIGLSMDNQKAVEFLDSWYAETENLFPNVNWFPEELSLSVVAWRLGLKADCWFGMVVCGDNELGFLKDTRPTLQFYCENVR